jgi:hypothetical protein
VIVHSPRAMIPAAVVVLALATPALAEPIEPAAVPVIDGDTIEARGAVWRLVGFDAPETAQRAQCSIEGERGAAARARLVAIVAGGKLDLLRVACSCRPGTGSGRKSETLDRHQCPKSQTVIASVPHSAINASTRWACPTLIMTVPTLRGHPIVGLIPVPVPSKNEPCAICMACAQTIRCVLPRVFLGAEYRFTADCFSSGMAHDG